MTNEDRENSQSMMHIPVNDFNSLNLRLNPEPVLNKILIFLRGEQEYQVQNDDGSVSIRSNKFGLRKASEEGIQSIYNWISGVINTQVVQGNFPVNNRGFSEKYEHFLYYFRNDFKDYLMLNKYEFEIEDNEYEGIIDFVMNIIGPFMSRLIGNEERQGISQTVKSTENNVVQTKPQGKWSLWNN